MANKNSLRGALAFLAALVVLFGFAFSMASVATAETPNGEIIWPYPDTQLRWNLDFGKEISATGKIGSAVANVPVTMTTRYLSGKVETQQIIADYDQEDLAIPKGSLSRVTFEEESGGVSGVWMNQVACANGGPEAFVRRTKNSSTARAANLTTDQTFFVWSSLGTGPITLTSGQSYEITSMGGFGQLDVRMSPEESAPLCAIVWWNWEGRANPKETDISVAVVAPVSAEKGVRFNHVVEIKNNGPLTAPVGGLFRMPTWISMISVETSAGDWFNNYPSIGWANVVLDPGQSAFMTVTMKSEETTGSASFYAESYVNSSYFVDPDMTNNRINAQTQIVSPPPVTPRCMILTAVQISENPDGPKVLVKAEGQPGPGWRIRPLDGGENVSEGGLSENGRLEAVIDAFWNTTYQVEIQNGDRWVGGRACQFEFVRVWIYLPTVAR